MKKLSEIIKTGTIDSKGVQEIENLIKENERLKSSFVYMKHIIKRDYATRIFTIWFDKENHAAKIINELIELASKKKKIKSSEIINLLS